MQSASQALLLSANTQDSRVSDLREMPPMDDRVFQAHGWIIQDCRPPSYARLVSALVVETFAAPGCCPLPPGRDAFHRDVEESGGAREGSYLSKLVFKF